MKQYIRTTQNFDNETREWIDRDEWRDPNTLELLKASYQKWSFGVHALRRDIWVDMDWIVDETIKMFKGHASDNTKEFLKFISETQNYQEIIQRDIEKEFETLIQLDMIRVREK